ncbi:MAG: hypothetical protein RL277_854 [Planctomycetota bacterium]|jgi:hypothetical protein
MSLQAAKGDAQALLRPQPASAAIGEPVLWTLEVRHSPSTRVGVGAAPPLDRTWVLLDGPTRLDNAEGFELRWRALSLEAGERVLPAPALSWNGQPLSLETQPLSVRAELALEEDAPRALYGAIAPPPQPPSLLLPALACGAVLLAGLGLFWWRRRRIRPAAPLPPSPQAELARLRELWVGSHLSARDAAFALTRLVRKARDEHDRNARAALTDEQWAMEAGELFRQLFLKAEAIKYAGAEPSRFLMEELFDGARTLLPQEEQVRA